MEIFFREAGMIAGGIFLQFRQIGLYWAIGLIAGSLVSVFLSDNIMEKMCILGSRKYRFSALPLSSLFGIISPLCMYGTVPIIAALGKRGLPQHLLASFMVSSILLNPNIFLFTFALGRNLALLRFGLSLLSGSLAGLLVMLFLSKKNLFLHERFAASDAKGKKAFFADLLKALRITFPYLLFGITLSTLFERYVPPDWIAGLFGQRQGLGVLFAASLSIPLYVCGGGTIPLLLSWMNAGMGYGDAMTFMLAGPALKINNLSAVKMILGNRHFILYIAFCLVFSIICGLLIELFLSAILL